MHALAEPRFQLLGRRGFVNQQPLADPTRRVGRNQAGSRLPLFVDLHQRAAVNAALLGPTALWRAAVMGHLRSARRLRQNRGGLQAGVQNAAGSGAQRRASIVPPAQRPIVNPAGWQHRQIGLAVGDDNRVQTGGIGLEVGGLPGSPLVATDARHPRQRVGDCPDFRLGENGTVPLTFAPPCLHHQVLDSTPRENMNILRQPDRRRPDLRRIGRRAGPIDGDPPFRQPRELLGQEQRSPRTGTSGATIPPERTTNLTSSTNAASNTRRAAV